MEQKTRLSGRVVVRTTSRGPHWECRNRTNRFTPTIHSRSVPGTSVTELVELDLKAHLSFLADVAVTPDSQISVEAHRNRQSLESFQVQRAKIKIQGRSRHTTSW
jgi:hypothetical protein